VILDAKHSTGQRHPQARGLLLLAFWLLIGAFSTQVRAEEADREVAFSGQESLIERLEAGEEIKLPGVQIAWEDGLHVTGHFEKVKVRMGGSVMVDGGRISADEELTRAFPGLEDNKTQFRRLRLNLSGTVYDAMEFKVDFDFANAREIKDEWIRFPGVPILERFRFGHQTEPFSLEEQTSSNHLTFMETALPTQVFAPGRNIGIRYDDITSDQRTTWAVGTFWATTSYGSSGDFKDRLSDPDGVNVTARLTHLLRYEDQGRELLHLGLAYSHQFRDVAGGNREFSLSARPETYLTNQKLVSTGNISADNRDLINTEFAMVSGPLSLQGEYFRAFSEGGESHTFWGFYLYGSWFLTGESRKYNKAQALFTGVDMNRSFHPLKGEWGALELGLRYSHLDLNDEETRGGRERNLTAGLNWYLYPEVRVMANYIRARVEDRANPSVDEGSANIWLIRFQFAL
jgi:phosphate-selective porin OprO and OprP